MTQPQGPLRSASALVAECLKFRLLLGRERRLDLPCAHREVCEVIAVRPRVDLQPWSMSTRPGPCSDPRRAERSG